MGYEVNLTPYRIKSVSNSLDQTVVSATKYIYYCPLIWEKIRATLGIHLTLIWFPGLNKLATNYLLNQSRVDLGLCVGFLTGHNRMRKHESVVSQGVDPSCRFCLEDEESAWHLIAECPALWMHRGQAFKSYQLYSNPKWKAHQFLSFLRDAKMSEFEKETDNVP